VKFIDSIDYSLWSWDIAYGSKGQIPLSYMKDLAWGGLHESSKWVQLSQDQKNEILQTNEEYRSGVKGVKCK
jgi:hypothetical protein